MSRQSIKLHLDNPRATAALLLRAVVYDGRSLTEQLRFGLRQINQLADRALIQELCYGVLRWYLRLNALADMLLKKPFKARDRDIELLVLVGLYQLLYLDKPTHAVVHETVEAARAMDKSWATGVVNALLRNCQRRKNEWLSKLDQSDLTRVAHPDWLLKILQDDWPQSWQTIVAENNQRPPLILRVNRLHHSCETYSKELQKAGIDVQPVPGSGAGLYLPNPVNVQTLPGFAKGWVSVQDAGAQKAAELLDAQAGDRVLDACAAPGGKTCHLLELAPKLGELVALDVDAKRIQSIEENLQRLNLQATVQVADAADTVSWWDGQPFQRILLDAPCSATGVIRRHPDIKLLRRTTDIEQLVKQQQRLLEALWPLLASGGMLLYVTCSVLKRENSEQMERFLNSHEDCHELPLPGDWGHTQTVGRQVLPGEQGMDGFYFAGVTKRS